jgi:acyl-CoA dehydrogenase
VASSDATNIEASIVRDGDHYVINGRKWWTTGGPDPRCKILIFMGKTDAANPDRHRQQSMILVPVDTPGVKLVRVLSVFGYDDAPHGHGEFDFDNVRVPAGNILLGEGRGFEIAQGRLGPGRIHHCMRLIGQAERSLDYMCRRAASRVAFGRTIADQTVTQERIAIGRASPSISAPRVPVRRLEDGRRAPSAEEGNDDQRRQARHGMPGDRRAMQARGGRRGRRFPLAFFYAQARTLRFADGPDEVHRNQIAKLELAECAPAKGKRQ